MAQLFEELTALLRHTDSHNGIIIIIVVVVAAAAAAAAVSSLALTGNNAPSVRSYLTQNN